MLQKINPIMLDWLVNYCGHEKIQCMHAVGFLMWLYALSKISVTSLRPKYCKSCGTSHGQHGRRATFIHVLPQIQGQSPRGQFYMNAHSKFS